MIVLILALVSCSSLFQFLCAIFSFESSFVSMHYLLNNYLTFPLPDMSLCDISLCLLSEFYYLIVSIQTCLYRWMEVRVMILVMMVNFF